MRTRPNSLLPVSDLYTSRQCAAEFVRGAAWRGTYGHDNISQTRSTRTRAPTGLSLRWRATLQAQRRRLFSCGREGVRARLMKAPSPPRRFPPGQLLDHCAIYSSELRLIAVLSVADAASGSARAELGAHTLAYSLFDASSDCSLRSWKRSFSTCMSSISDGEEQTTASSCPFPPSPLRLSLIHI